MITIKLFLEFRRSDWFKNVKYRMCQQLNQLGAEPLAWTSSYLPSLELISDSGANLTFKCLLININS